MGIVVIGMIFVDIKGYPEASFIPTGRNVGRVERVHGGVGRNVAEDIANCELRPTLVSLTDESGDGEDVLRKLRNHKVNTDYIRKTPDGLGTWLAVFDNAGDVAASISKRPDMTPILDILDSQGDEIFAGADSVIVEIDLDKEIIKRVFRLAKKHDKKVYAVVGNMSVALERRDFMKSTDCLVCNIQEAGLLFFEDFSHKAPEEMVDILAEKADAIRLASDNRQAAEAAFAFQHELAMLSGNTLLPLIFRSFYSSVLVLWERFCQLHGVPLLYEISSRLCAYIRERDVSGAVAWVDHCTQEAISGSRQIYY